MTEIRELIQEKLDEITTIDSGVPIPDHTVTEGVTSFGSQIQEDFMGNDFDNNYDMEVNVIGRLVRKMLSSENTQQIMDEAVASLKAKFKEINFKYSYNDVSYESDTDNFCKILFKAQGRYCEIDDTFIV